jgi:hypothetical protein
MTRDGKGEIERAGGRPRQAGEPEDTGRVPLPSPEEAPELLGERSDYPIPFGDEGAGRARSSKPGGRGERSPDDPTARPRK